MQQEPATALDPELMGPLAAIGIIKGKPFNPDARMKKIMTEAAALPMPRREACSSVRATPRLVLLSGFGMDEFSVRGRLRNLRRRSR